MKDSRKLITLTQVEKTLQTVVDRIITGKENYSREVVLALFRAIDIQLIKIANDNYRKDLYLGEDEEIC